MFVDDHPNDPPPQPQTPGKIRPSARAPWRAYFYDHPKLTIDKAQAHAGGKPKLYCKECFATHLAQLRSQDTTEVNTNCRAEARSDEMLTTHLWETKKPRDTTGVIGWIRGEGDTILNHLRQCERQPDCVRDEAANKYRGRRGKGQQMGPPTVNTPAVQAEASFLPSLGSPGNSQLQGATYLPVPSSNEFAGYPGSRSAGSSVIGDSRSNSPYPDSSLLGQNSSRSSSAQPRVMNWSPTPMEWSADRQNTFNMRIARLTASAGLPLCWIENPEFILFCQEFVHPAAIVPGRKAMTNRILPTLKRDFRKRAQAVIRKGATATTSANRGKYDITLRRW